MVTASPSPSDDQSVDTAVTPAPLPPLPEQSAAEAARVEKAAAPTASSRPPKPPRPRRPGSSKTAAKAPATPPKPAVSAAEAAALFAEEKAAEERAADEIAADEIAADEIAADEIAADEIAADEIAAGEVADRAGEAGSTEATAADAVADGSAAPVAPPRKPRVPRKTKKRASVAAEVDVVPSPDVDGQAIPDASRAPGKGSPSPDVEALATSVLPTDAEDAAVPTGAARHGESSAADLVAAEPEADVLPVVGLEPEADADIQPETDADLQPEAGVDVHPDAVLVDIGVDITEEDDAALVLEQEPLSADEEAAGSAARPAEVADRAEREVASVPDPDVAALQLRGVSKSFGETKAVDSIDITVRPGTFYGVVGPNGAGKTTTLSMATGLLRPDHGTIEVAGVDLGAEPARAKRLMGVLPDRLRTFDRLTGRQLLHYYGVLRGLRPAVVESRVADLARAFDLTDALGRTVADYSAGMTKKVMLAGAMIHSPRLLVLDEPFESVDPVSSAVILDILKAYVAHGGTVVLSSHGMELVERVCSGVAVIVAGQVLAEGTVEEVRGELTLEQRFIELAGGLSDVEGLEWLHTFSG